MDDKKARRLAEKYIKSKALPSSLKFEFEKNNCHLLLENVYRRTAQLIQDNQHTSKEKMEHLKQILPCIAFYETLLKREGNQAAALLLYEKWCFMNINKAAKMITAFLKVPGLYRKVPGLMRKVINSKFNQAAGFHFKEREQKNGFAVDMLKCPYADTCNKYGYPQITRFFCEADDICYGNMHPKLIWERNRTLASGGDCCDSKLYIKD